LATSAPKPVIVFYGTKDPGPFSVDDPALDTYNAAGAKGHSITIGGANHFAYTDSLCILADGPATVSQADPQRIAKAYLTAFFRRYLNGALEVKDYLTVRGKSRNSSRSQSWLTHNPDERQREPAGAHYPQLIQRRRSSNCVLLTSESLLPFTKNCWTRNHHAG